ncbi:minor capsid protein [Parafannyhessea umbonata]|uniref:minor capsid protein n=1 Tax=Parafannyhessea umbonata TaxID=604330 RepID=UPI0026E93AEE|nr:minor capsid protein [Parafannyhessea umbonata]MDD6601758.1 minor capsid protein [Parafannyhessea umbonata]
MRYLRPIPRRLLPDDMLVYPSDGQGGRGAARLVRHVRLELADEVSDEPHRESAPAGRVFVDAVNSAGAFEVPAGSRVVVGSLPGMLVRRCRRCAVVRGQVHHWELEVG